MTLWRRFVSPVRRVYLIAAGVGVLVFGLFFWAPEFLKIVETKLYDLHFMLRGARDPGDQVVIVAIDEKSIAAVGRWPWPRSVLARLVTALSSAGAKVIALDILLSEPERSGELRAADKLSERLAARGLSGSSAPGQLVREELAVLVRDADHDAQLEQAIARSDRVILPIMFEIKPGVPDGAPEPSGPPLRSALTSFGNYAERGLFPPPSALQAGAPIPQLAKAARDLGHVTMVADQDGTTRWEALIFEYHGYYYPSLAVQAVRLARSVEPAAVKLDFGRALHLGAIDIPLDPRDRMLIDYAGPASTFCYLS